jgi:hypothetical protein
MNSLAHSIPEEHDVLDEPETTVSPASRRAPADRFLLALAVALVGYALAGRGFAYIGLPPLFVGEALLGAGALVLLATRDITRMLDVPQTLVLLAWVAWCMLRTLPCVPQYGIDALRDGVIWGYAAFALIVAAVLLEKPERLARLIGYYRRFPVVFLALIPLVYIAYRGLGDALPKMPGQKAPIVQVKEADVLVHLAGILSFWAVGFAGRRVAWPWLLLMAVSLGAMGVVDRAGLVAFGAAVVLCLLLAPRSSAPRRIIVLGVAGAFALWASGLRLEVPGGKGREISFQQFATNIGSIFGDANNDGLDSTKEWRVNWWRDIRDYTVNGKYFWTGKGFGINLADDDGYQVLSDGSLRSPHSVHMMVLARAGVPGVALWGLTQLVFGCGITAAHFRCRRLGHDRWARLFLFVGTYWLVLLINGSFDVFIEGPMGGIWFWTVIGVGLAALGLYRQRPELLDELPVEGEPQVVAIESTHGGAEEESRTNENTETQRHGGQLVSTSALWNTGFKCSMSTSDLKSES